MISETPEKSYVDPTDYPREVICEMATRVVNESRCHVDVFFKATCPFCSQRCTFQEPNKLYEFMECFGCGKEFPVHKAGFALHFHVNQPKERQ